MLNHIAVSILDQHQHYLCRQHDEHRKCVFFYFEEKKHKIRIFELALVSATENALFCEK